MSCWLTNSQGAGVVHETGSDVVDIGAGDTVLLSYNYCDSCHTCNRGHPYYCDHIMALSFGGSRLDGSQTMRRKDGSPLYGSFFGQSSFLQSCSGEHAMYGQSRLAGSSASLRFTWLRYANRSGRYHECSRCAVRRDRGCLWNRGRGLGSRDRKRRLDALE